MYAFIGGTSASGKTHLANKFAKNSKLNIHVVSIDDLRKEFAKDPKLKYWTDILWNKNEKEYWENITYKEDIGNLIKQSEAFWPRILEAIKKTKEKYEHAIFEAVNIQLKNEAKKYGFKVFNNSEEAFKELQNIFS